MYIAFNFTITLRYKIGLGTSYCPISKTISKTCGLTWIVKTFQSTVSDNVWN